MPAPQHTAGRTLIDPEEIDNIFRLADSGGDMAVSLSAGNGAMAGSLFADASGRADRQPQELAFSGNIIGMAGSLCVWRRCLIMAGSLRIWWRLCKTQIWMAIAN